jgi:hypothetical protein
MTLPTNTFEDRLLDALLDRFDAQVHEPTISLVSAPRPAGIRRYALPVGCLAAAATAASLTLVELGGPAPVKHVRSATPTYALAAWTAQPTSARPAQISTAESLCSASFEQIGTPEPVGAQKHSPPPAGGPWTPVLADTRGDLTLALYSYGAQRMACLAGPSFISLSEIDDTGELPVAGNSATLDRVSIRNVSGDLYTVAIGRSGSGVTGVALQRSDDSMVTATVGDDRFIAWWPEAAGVKALSVTTSAGTHNYPVDPRFTRSGPQPTNKTLGASPRQPSSKSR